MPRLDTRSHWAPRGWMIDAACRGTDPEVFYDGRAADAIRICRTCPVTEECYRYWLSLPIDQSRHGVWAGMTRHQLEHTQARRAWAG